jgi:hypothetical protein
VRWFEDPIMVLKIKQLEKRPVQEDPAGGCFEQVSRLWILP